MSEPAAHRPTRPGHAAYDRGLHVYCVALAAAVLVLISAGGMVTSTGSGLSVPDWPTTYGHNMFTFPISRWTGGILYEHSHRLIASGVGILTIGLVILAYRREKRAWMRRMALAALALVIVQGLLGGLTVRWLLPTPVSVFHGCLAQIFLCVVTAMAVFTSRRWMAASPRRVTSSRLAVPTLACGCVCVVFLQLVAGAVMRHTHSGLAVPDFPLAYGHVVPPLDDASMERYNEARVWQHQLPAVTRTQIVWHLLHRGGAVIASALVIFTAGLGLARHGSLNGIARPAQLMAAIVVVQVTLGAWTVLSVRPPLVATAHVAVGAALLAICVVFWLMSRSLLAIEPAQAVRSGLAPAGAKA